MVLKKIDSRESTSNDRFCIGRTSTEECIEFKNKGSKTNNTQIVLPPLLQVCLLHDYVSMIMKMKMIIKNESHRQNINRSRRRQRNKFTKYKKCLAKIMPIHIKQGISNNLRLNSLKKLSNTETHLRKSHAL